MVEPVFLTEYKKGTDKKNWQSAIKNRCQFLCKNVIAPSFLLKMNSYVKYVNCVYVAGCRPRENLHKDPTGTVAKISL